jgi:hypothetical protein
MGLNPQYKTFSGSGNLSKFDILLLLHSKRVNVEGSSGKNVNLLN